MLDGGEARTTASAPSVDCHKFNDFFASVFSLVNPLLPYFSLRINFVPITCLKNSLIVFRNKFCSICVAARTENKLVGKGGAQRAHYKRTSVFRSLPRISTLAVPRVVSNFLSLFHQPTEWNVLDCQNFNPHLQNICHHWLCGTLHHSRPVFEIVWRAQCQLRVYILMLQNNSFVHVGSCYGFTRFTLYIL